MKEEHRERWDQQRPSRLLIDGEGGRGTKYESHGGSQGASGAARGIETWQQRPLLHGRDHKTRPTLWPTRAASRPSRSPTELSHTSRQGSLSPAREVLLLSHRYASKRGGPAEESEVARMRCRTRCGARATQLLGDTRELEQPVA